MPELPDVEVFKQYADATVLHQTIRKVDVHDKNMLESVSAAGLRKSMESAKFEATRRIGKYLFLRISGGDWLVLHFGMTGFLKYFRNEEEAPEHIRLLIHFPKSYRLAYDCQRRFGIISLTDDLDQFVREKKLGPDFLQKEVDKEFFRERLKKSRGTLKSALMNQSLIAGLGNIYSDEALFHANIHPGSSTGSLNDKQFDEIFKSIMEVIDTAVNARVDPEKFPENYLINYREADVPCPKCGGMIRKEKIASRSACFCDQHQKLIE